jgi:two-component system, chemotaxis family, sensor kinase CheA
LKGRKLDDLLNEFVAETRDTLETLAGQLVVWEKNPHDQQLIDSVFRFVHTVKGSCGFLDLPRLLRLSHAAEDVMSAAREGALVASTGLVSAVLAVIDQITLLTDAIETGQPVIDIDQSLIATVQMFLVDHPGGAEVSVTEADLMIDAKAERPKSAKSRSVRVSLTLLDQLMNGISDLVLARNELSRQSRVAKQDNNFAQSFGRLSGTVTELRDCVSMMRMQSIERLFSALPRQIRDIGVELGKDVELQIHGSDVEVDRDMVDMLRDPLIHIIRNAMDHGIEPVEERLELGKPGKGNIRVTARQSGNQILIEVADDGRGIDLDRLYRKAIDSAVITEIQWMEMSQKERFALICHPGLSTARAISNISGRGVGMDIVANNVRAVGGAIDLESVEGQGLKITLRMPLTLSIIAGLLVRVGCQQFGISRNSVIEMISSTNPNVRLETVAGKDIAIIRELPRPYARLDKVLGLEDTVQEISASRTLIVIRPAEGADFVLEVDAVIDTEELVVRPGAPAIMASGLYSGTALPDNGRPILLLDASGLASAISPGAVDANRRDHDNISDAGDAGDVDIGLPVLLFQNLAGQLAAIRLSVISRTEDIDAEEVRELGGEICATIDGAIFTVHGLQEKCPERRLNALRLGDGQSEILLAVRDVIDIVTVKGELRPASDSHRCEGIFVHDGAPVELLNPFQFFAAGNRTGIDRNGNPDCFIDWPETDNWARNILAPMLGAAGYLVSFDKDEMQDARLVIRKEALQQVLEAKSETESVILLREHRSPTNTNEASIYRYNSVGLLDAIEKRLVANGN